MTEINIQTVFNEALALSALHTLQPDTKEPLLTRDRLPAMRVVARMAFAELVLAIGSARLTPMLDNDDAIDGSDPDAPHLRYELPDNGGLPEGTALAVKRQMEHLLALSILIYVARPEDAIFADTLEAQRALLLAKLPSLLDPPLPRRRRRSH